LYRDYAVARFKVSMCWISMALIYAK
jgi:hypothetical protein